LKIGFRTVSPIHKLVSC